MATKTGNYGLIKIGANVVAEMRSWEISEAQATTDDTVIRDDWETHKKTQKSWTGSCQVFYDPASAGQNALPIGAEVTPVFYPMGDASGDPTESGAATVVGRRKRGSHTGMVELDLELKGNGALTPATV